MTSSRARVIAFLLLTFGLSSIFYVQIAAAGRMRMIPTLGLMWCPGAAAIIVRLASERSLAGIGWGVGIARWQVVSYLLPPLLGVVVYGLVWTTGLGTFTPSGLAFEKDAGIQAPALVVFVIVVTIGFLSAIVFTLGEEIGWRGLLVPELARISSFTKTALIAGAVWAVYHYPLIFFSNYRSDTPRWFSLTVFTWMIVASSFVYAWLRLKSGSVWTGVILHASHNLFIQQIFDPLTGSGPWTKYVTTEFGTGLALAYTLVAIYFWRRRDEVVTADNDRSTRPALAV